MKKALITQSNYIPWKGFFDGINMVDEFIVYDDMQYTRRDWRNRNYIKTKDGLQWLTIPVEVKGKYFQKINETVISDPSWGLKHWRAIEYNYQKAPFFKLYKDQFEGLYLHDEAVLLTEINLKFIHLVCDLLGIKTKIGYSSDFVLKEDKTERLVDICKQIGATDYYTGPAGKAYMKEEMFAREAITVHYFDYGGYPEYHQLFDKFAHNVSIIDLLFNEGENAKKYMKSF